VFDEQDAGFEVMIAANQNRRNPSILLLISRNEILKIRAVVVLLATAHAELTNCRDKLPKRPFTDQDFGGSFAPFERRDDSSYLEPRLIRQRLMGSEQTSQAQSFRSGASTKLYQHKSFAVQNRGVSTSVVPGGEFRLLN
jgi:hypothetical protein